jgi:5'-AMP-activated protein kinase catalytic alpha subunit
MLIGLDELNKNKKFVILRTLGKGSFGKVKEALHILTGEKVAIKILEKSKIKGKDDLKRVKREIFLMKKLRHPNITRLYEVIETDKFFFLVMEYASGGDLANLMDKERR